MDIKFYQTPAHAQIKIMQVTPISFHLMLEMTTTVNIELNMNLRQVS